MTDLGIPSNPGNLSWLVTPGCHMLHLFTNSFLPRNTLSFNQSDFNGIGSEQVRKTQGNFICVLFTLPEHLLLSQFCALLNDWWPAGKFPRSIKIFWVQQIVSAVISRQNVFYNVLVTSKSDPKLGRREIYWIEPQWLHLSHFTCVERYYLGIRFCTDSLTVTESFTWCSRRRLGNCSKSMWFDLWTRVGPKFENIYVSCKY